MGFECVLVSIVLRLLGQEGRNKVPHGTPKDLGPFLLRAPPAGSNGGIFGSDLSLALATVWEQTGLSPKGACSTGDGRGHTLRP